MSQASERMYRALELITRSQEGLSEPGATIDDEYTEQEDLVDALTGMVDLFNLLLLQHRQASQRSADEVLQRLGQAIAVLESRGD